MSLVQGIITDNFILMCSEKRGNNKKGLYHENINKMVKLNKNIILGCTGNIKDNQILFAGHLKCDIENGLIQNAYVSDDFTYIDFKQQIVSNFNCLKNIHEDDKETKYDIGSMIAGFNGEQFEIIAFYLSEDKIIPNGIYPLLKDNASNYALASCGKQIHNDNFRKLAQIYHPNTILQYKNIFYEVLEKGIKVDDTINNIACFEVIKKKDVVNN